MDFSKISEGHEDGEKPLVFYYNREERLKHAPQNVRDYYDGKIKAFKPGLFKALIATKANRFILFALVICFAVVVFNIFFGPKANVETYKGIPLTLKTLHFYNSNIDNQEDGIYIVLEIADVEKKYRGIYKDERVKVNFRILNVDNQIVHKEIIEKKYSGKKTGLGFKLSDYALEVVDAKHVEADIELLDTTIFLKTDIE